MLEEEGTEPSPWVTLPPGWLARSALSRRVPGDAPGASLSPRQSGVGREVGHRVISNARFLSLFSGVSLAATGDCRRSRGRRRWPMRWRS